MFGCRSRASKKSEVEELHAAGAVACVNKDEELEEIVAAIHAAAGNLSSAEWN